MSALELTVKSGVAACGNSGYAATGTILYRPAPLGDVAPGINLIGNPNTGAQTGDRTLAVGAGETLCFSVGLPANSSATYQGAATTATFEFAAEQTRNN